MSNDRRGLIEVKKLRQKLIQNKSLNMKKNVAYWRVLSYINIRDMKKCQMLI